MRIIPLTNARGPWKALLVMLQASVKDAAIHQLFILCYPSYKWLDAEGASLIGTMRKLRGAEAPEALRSLIALLSERVKLAPPPAAVESYAQGVALLLPALIECAPSLVCSPRRRPVSQADNCSSF